MAQPTTAEPMEVAAPEALDWTMVLLAVLVLVVIAAAWILLLA